MTYLEDGGMYQPGDCGVELEPTQEDLFDIQAERYGLPGTDMVGEIDRNEASGERVYDLGRVKSTLGKLRALV